MPDGEPHTMLSPIEKAVLTSCEPWRSIEELQLDLAPEFHFDRIPSAVAFLRRRRLLEVYPSAIGLDATYQQTPLGVLVLQAQRRRENAHDYLPERRLQSV